MQGTRGQIRTGGDGGGELNGSPPTQAPLALYSGIVTVQLDGTAEVAFDIPAFAGTVRVMAVAWSKDKVGRAIGDVIVRDPVVLTATLAALPAHRRPQHDASRPRQCRRRGGRLQPSRSAPTARSPSATARRKTLAAARQAARPRGRAAHRLGRRARDRQGRDQRAGRLRARAQLRAERQAGDADAGAPHGEADRQGREPDAVERPVRRSGAGHRRGCRCRSASRPRSTRRRCSRRSTAIRSAAPSRSPAGRCRCSTSTSWRAQRISRSTTPSTSASATPSSACWRARRRTARSASGASAATTPGSTPTSPTS